MRRFRALVALSALLAACIGTPAWATGEETACVDVEKTCSDAGSPDDPISFDVTLTNCGDVIIYCNVKDLITHEILINGPVPVGESVQASGAYYLDECGESTNEVLAQCSYQVEVGVVEHIVAEAQATCSVPCEGDPGCTLARCYWKTHSKYGPAPADPAWALIGEDSPFFLSGKSFIETLWAWPRYWNAYYTLAPAYITAQLNVLNGASVPPEVATVLGDATDLFETYTPGFIGSLWWGHPLRMRFLAMARTLRDYNNGILGPGPCHDGADGHFLDLFLERLVSFLAGFSPGDHD